MQVNRINKFLNYTLTSILLVLLLHSCEAQNNVKYIPEFGFEKGAEELGIKEESTLQFEFQVFRYQYILNLQLQKDLVDQTKKLPKTVLLNEGEKLSSAVFYKKFFNDKNDVAVLEDILDKINSRTKETDFDDVDLIVNFVQAIPYEESIPQKYPLETLFSTKGDCSDKSILLAKLLDLAGYEVCLFIYNKAQHVAVGIATDDKTQAYRSGYTYIESTGYNQIGNLPAAYGGLTISEEPIVVPISTSKKHKDNSKISKKSYQHLKPQDNLKSLTKTHHGKIVFNDILKRNEAIQLINNDLEKTRNSIAILEKKMSQNKCGIIDETKTNLCSTLNKSVIEKLTISKRLAEQYNVKAVSINREIKLFNNIHKEYEFKTKILK